MGLQVVPAAVDYEVKWKIPAYHCHHMRNKYNRAGVGYIQRLRTELTEKLNEIGHSIRSEVSQAQG